MWVYRVGEGDRLSDIVHLCIQLRVFIRFVKPFNNGLKSVSVPALNRIISMGWNYD